MLLARVEKKLNNVVVVEATLLIDSAEQLHEFLTQMEYYQTKSVSDFQYHYFRNEEKVYTVDLGTTPDFSELELN